MINFPVSFVKYAKTQGCFIGLNDFKGIETPAEPYTAAGNISVTQLEASSVSQCPAYENYVLGFVLRHPVFDIDDPTVGISAVQTAFYDFFKTLVGGQALDDNFRIVTCEEIIDSAHRFGYTDNHHTLLTRVQFEVIDLYRTPER